MKRKQSMALLFAAVSSVAIYSEVQAAEIIESSDFAVDSYFQGAVQLPNSEASVAAATNLPVVTNLNDLQQIIYTEMQNFTETFQVQYKGNTQELDSKLMDLLIETKEKDDYTLGTVLSYGYSLKGYENDVTLTINLGYTTTVEQEAYVKSEVKRLVAELITPTMSDVEKVKVINEYIVKKTTYTTNTKASPHAAYTILTEGKGVCQAYAMLAYMMLTEAGMEAHYVTGFAKEDHAWNLVKVDGEWYHLDPTWNDPTFSSSVASYAGISEYISYDYFLISDKVISQDHKIDKRPGLPTATSERFSALRIKMSTLFTMNGIPYMLLPEYIDGKLYFVNYSDRSYVINQVDLLASTPTVEIFANVSAMDILATNEALYFVDLDRQFGLSKIDLATKEVTSLHTENVITSIKRDAQNVYAYHHDKLVYSEPIAGSEQGTSAEKAKAEEVEKLTSNIEFLSKNFANRAEQVLTLVRTLGSAGNQLLSPQALAQVKAIETKYEKMKNLTFNQTTPWKDTPAVTKPRKPWTVTLSQAVKNTEENLKNVQVVNMFGDPVDVSIKVEGKKVIVTPNADYVAEIPYTLVISAGLENEQGGKLQKGTHVTFTFK